MQILFDHCTPAPLRHHLPRHTVITAFEQQWHQLKNGVLLTKGEENGFHLLITSDRDFTIYEEGMKDRTIALIVLGSGQWPFIQKRIAQIISAVDAARPGSYCFIEISPSR